MRPALARLLLALYPRPWRQRYGDEFEALLLESPDDILALVDIALSAAKERIFPIAGLQTQPAAIPFRVVAKQPSAILPLAVSAAALGVVLAHVALFGIVHEKDEGAAAHIWQLLIAGDLPLIVFFAVKWLPRAAKQAVAVLLIVSALMLANIAAVYFLT